MTTEDIIFGKDLHIELRPLNSGFVVEVGKRTQAIENRQNLEFDMKRRCWELIEDFLSRGNVEIKIDLKVVGRREVEL